MTQNHCLPIGAFNDGRYYISQLKFHIGIWVVLTAKFYNIIMQPPGLCGGGGDMLKAVPPVNIQHSTHRPHAMGWLQITVAFHGVLGAPLGFAVAIFAKFNTPSVWLFAIVEFYMAQVVLITTLAM